MSLMHGANMKTHECILLYEQWLSSFLLLSLQHEDKTRTLNPYYDSLFPSQNGP